MVFHVKEERFDVKLNTILSMLDNSNEKLRFKRATAIKTDSQLINVGIPVGLLKPFQRKDEQLGVVLVRQWGEWDGGESSRFQPVHLWQRTS